jgi:glycosyltransferase involved in cell wall biosynthesis
MSLSLSVVMPVYNEAEQLPATIAALAEAVARSPFHAELVLVDDGSTDGSAQTARDALAKRLPLQVVSEPNRGRFAARKAGLEAATHAWVLFLDGRVRLRPESLAFVCDRLEAGETIWNGHVYVDTERNPYGAFWNVLVELAWREYFARPRKTSFDATSFDRYPKGTTCFLVPRELMLEAFGAFRSGYSDLRHANDDTPLLRWIAERRPIHIAPSFGCDYSPRATLFSFVRHAVHRGSVFLDGHGRPNSGFFMGVVAFFPVSAALGLACVRRPVLVPALAATSAAAAGAVAAAAGRSGFETRSFAALAPVYAVAHGLGMWRGLAMLLLGRVKAAAGM